MTPKEKVLRNMLTAGEVAAMFNRTTQSVALWRKLHGLPYVRIRGDARDTIRYRRGAVLRWAKLHGREPVKTQARKRVRV